MFNPKFTITQKLLENIKHITVLVTELNNKNFPNTALLDFEKVARAVSSYSSTSIEGNPLPLTEVKKILKAKPENIRDTQREVLNYNSALEKLNKLTKKKEDTLSLKLVLEVQRLVTDKLISSSNCGKLRREPVFVNDPRTRKTIYLPPDHKDVKLLLENLISFTKQNKSKIDFLILSGICHKQFVIIHPFLDGNGRTARLLTKLLLRDMGLNTFNLFSFENYYNLNVTKYFQKVGLLGNYYDLKNKIDFTEWLEYFTDGIIDELLRVSKELQSLSFTPDKRLEDYHEKLLEYIKKQGYINDKLYSPLTTRAKATRSLDFQKLIKLDLIQRFGKGKSTYYKLK